jgi:putative flavoprotein involved in K+ transport
LPLLANGRTLSVKNVIWCTGYHHGFPWIELPIFDQGGEVVHEAGIIHNVPGIYFVGLNFLYSMTSATLMGIGRDSERVVDALWRRMTPSLVNDRIESDAKVA